MLLPCRRPAYCNNRREPSLKARFPSAKPQKPSAALQNCIIDLYYKLNKRKDKTYGVELRADFVNHGFKHRLREKLGEHNAESGEKEAAENEREYPAPEEAFASAYDTAEESVCLLKHGCFRENVEKLEREL